MKHRVIKYIFLGLLTVQGILIWKDVLPAWSLIILILAYVALLAYGATVVSFQYFLPIRCHGPRDSRLISITFDDGPVPSMTERILSILKEHQVEAAFFCIGNRVQSNPGLVSQIHSGGHIVGNHTFSHSNMFDLLGKQRMMDELSGADRAVMNTLRLAPRFFRPPYGVTNPNLAAAVGQGGYVTVGWSVRSFDTITPDASRLLARVKRQVKSGDIVLFHDYCESTIQILPDFLRYVASLGLKVVRVDKLLNENPYA